jgi:predicted phosphoadenosine phosphosulfate sulfurtransferase
MLKTYYEIFAGVDKGESLSLRFFLLMEKEKLSEKEKKSFLPILKKASHVDPLSSFYAFKLYDFQCSDTFERLVTAVASSTDERALMYAQDI